MVRDPKKDEAKANFSADLAQAREDSEDATREGLRQKVKNTSPVSPVDSDFPPEAKHCPMCGEEFCRLFKCKWIWGAIIIALAAWYFWGKG
tara:strand:- start:556 stop:828 length:273 start_codon:yes stop_codon:yes gene_type:complete